MWDGGEAMRGQLVRAIEKKSIKCWILIKHVEKSSVFDGGGMLEFVVDTFIKKNLPMPNYLKWRDDEMSWSCKKW
jgi:hypothetical protein